MPNYTIHNIPYSVGNNNESYVARPGECNAAFAICSLLMLTKREMYAMCLHA